MVMPYEIPLMEAMEALEKDELDRAQSLIERYFANVETDRFAVDTRNQHFLRQVFEPNSLSSLTCHEIDAWQILAVVRLYKGNFEDARQACYKQLELIDEFYAYSTPSWKEPAKRIPANADLLARYNRIANVMLEIANQENDSTEIQKWTNVAAASSADVQGEVVWERWISSSGDTDFDAAIEESTGIFDFIQWEQKRLEADGINWIVNCYRVPPQAVHPATHTCLIRITIPTDENAEVPSRALRWRIWSLRSAISKVFKRKLLGSLICETQCKGLRKISYYVNNEFAARTEVESILKDAEELSPVLEISSDPGWLEYQNWGGAAILQTPPIKTEFPAISDSDATDTKVLKRCLGIIEGISDLWGRFYTLTWACNSLPPADEKLKKYCLEYLFALADQMTGENKTRARVNLIWKLPAIDSQSAIRVFDEFYADLPPELDQCSLNLATEEFASCDPQRASLLMEVLKDYPLVHKAMAKLAEAFSKLDPEQMREWISRSKMQIMNSKELDSAVAGELADFARTTAKFAPKETIKDLIQESFAICNQNEQDTDYKLRSLIDLAELASTVDTELAKSICNDAVSAARELESESENASGWFSQSGPEPAARGLGSVAQVLSVIDTTSSVEILSLALETSTKIDQSYGLLSVLSGLAEAAGKIDHKANKELAGDIWRALNECIARGLTEADAMYIRRDLNRALPIFLSMNTEVTAVECSSFLIQCRDHVSPDEQLTWTCQCAAAVARYSMEKANQLLLSARNISSSAAYQKSKFICTIAVTMKAMGQETDALALLEEAQKVAFEVQDLRTRYDLMLDLTEIVHRDFSLQAEALFVAEAMRIAPQIELNPFNALIQLREKPIFALREIFLFWAERDKAKGSDELSQWIHKYSQEKAGNYVAKVNIVS